MAAAGYRFVESLLSAKWGGKSGVVEMSCTLQRNAGYSKLGAYYYPTTRCAAQGRSGGCFCSSTNHRWRARVL